jgi:hypothetical protein
MPWHTSDLVQQREEFVKRADVGEEYFSGLCLSFGISRVTGYRWLRRCAPVFFPREKIHLATRRRPGHPGHFRGSPSLPLAFAFEEPVTVFVS